MKITIEITGEVLKEFKRLQAENPTWDANTIVEYLVIRGIVEYRKTV